MTYITENFTEGARLRASQLTQLDTNIDAVRVNHIGSVAPLEATLGAVWVDSSESVWSVNQYDGTEWVEVFRISPSGHIAYHPMNINLVSDDSIPSDAIVQHTLQQAKLASGMATPNGVANGAIATENIDSDAASSIVGNASLISFSPGRNKVKLGLGSASGSGTGLISLDKGSFFPAVEVNTNWVNSQFRVLSMSNPANKDAPQVSISAGVGAYDVEWYYIDE